MRLVVEPPTAGGGGGKGGVVKEEVGGAKEEEEEPHLRPQSWNRMLQALLVHHFSLMKMLACILIESNIH